MVYTRKFKHPKEELLAEGKKIIATDRDSKFLFRVTMVNLILSGIKPSELSNYCGVDERTLSGWVAKADNDGFESLRAVKQTGRPSKLSDEQKEKIKVVIKEDSSIYGYTNWDGPSLSDFISKEFGVEYSIRACQKLFHELGFSQIRPQTYPSLNEPDEDAREAFKERVAEVFSDPSMILVFQDEVHFSIQSTITREWAQKGSEPKVKSYPGRRNASYSGFVVPEPSSQAESSLFVSYTVRSHSHLTLTRFRFGKGLFKEVLSNWNPVLIAVFDDIRLHESPEWGSRKVPAR